MNQLTSLPISFGNLTSLQFIDLNDNQLTSLPASFGNLANLQILELSDNQLTSLPNSFENLVKLEQFFAANNQLSGHFPRLFGFLKNVIIYNNNYTFDASETLLKRRYIAANPQANIPLHINGNTLSTYAGGTLSNNTYTWYKKNKNNVVATITGDSTYQPDSSGLYFVQVINAKVEGKLILYSDTVNFTLSPVKQNNVITAKNNTVISNDKNAFTIYPNPAKCLLHIDFSGMKDAVSVLQITSSEGKIITEKSIEAIKNIAVDVSGFAQGIYFVTIKTNNNSITQKFVKE